MTQRLPRREWPGGLGAAGQFGAASPTDGDLIRVRLDGDGGSWTAVAGWSGVGPVRVTCYVDTLPEADAAPDEALQFGPLEPGPHDVDLFPWRVGWPGPPQLVPDLNGGRAYLTWSRVSGASAYLLYDDDDGQLPEPEQLSQTLDLQRFGPARSLQATTGSGTLDSDGDWSTGDTVISVTANGSTWQWESFSGSVGAGWASAGTRRLRLSAGASGTWSFQAGPPNRTVGPALSSGIRQFAISSVVSGVEGPKVSGSMLSFGSPTQPEVSWLSGTTFGFTQGPAAVYAIDDVLWPVAYHSGSSGQLTMPSGTYYLRGARFSGSQFVAPTEFNFAAIDLVNQPTGRPNIRTVAASGTPNTVSVWVGIGTSGQVDEPVRIWAYAGASGSSGSGVGVEWSGSYGYPESIYRVDLPGPWSGTVWTGSAATYSGSGTPWPVADDVSVNIPTAPLAPATLSATAT